MNKYDVTTWFSYILDKYNKYSYELTIIIYLNNNSWYYLLVSTTIFQSNDCSIFFVNNWLLFRTHFNM